MSLFILVNILIFRFFSEGLEKYVANRINDDKQSEFSR